MLTKLFEVRDAATFIPVVAIKMTAGSDQENFLMRRAGYSIGGDCVLLSKLDGGPAQYDEYDWGSRTMIKAHHYIRNNFDKLNSGEVIDVEHIMGITPKPKISERKSFFHE